MSENIFEHTTSIAGLTCKPLAILSETISPQEMSRARGGDGMGGPGGGPQPGQDPGEHQREQAERQARQAEAQRLLDEQTKPTDTAGLGGPLGGTYIPIVDVSGSLNTNAQADSSGTQDQNGGSLDNGVITWDFDFLDDGTEDECTVPYDCGDDEEEEDYSEEETEEETEPSP